MKSLKLFHFIVCFLMVISLSSCADEPMELNPENELIGEWQRNDSSDLFGYTLNFDANNSGYRTVFTKDVKSDAIASSLIMFEWTVENNTLNISGLEDIDSCSFSFDADGHLVLSDLAEYYFIRK